MEDGDQDDMAAREWERIKESSEKMGFREGVGAGADEGLQKGFDDGYKVALTVSKFYNTLRGRLAVKAFLLQEEHEKVLNLPPEAKSTKNLKDENPPQYESSYSGNDQLVASEQTVLRYIEQHFYNKNCDQRTEKLVSNSPLQWIDLAGERSVIDRWI